MTSQHHTQHQTPHQTHHHVRMRVSRHSTTQKHIILSNHAYHVTASDTPSDADSYQNMRTTSQHLYNTVRHSIRHTIMSEHVYNVTAPYKASYTPSDTPFSVVQGHQKTLWLFLPHSAEFPITRQTYTHTTLHSSEPACCF
jgi:hypothetical protein